MRGHLLGWYGKGMSKILTLVFASSTYLFFLASFVYAVGWLGDFPFMPTTIDGQPGNPFVRALLVDVGLLSLFAVQHSVMARPRFKKWWTRFVPPPIERAVYVLFSSICLFAITLGWQTLAGTLWHLEGWAATLMWTSYVLGWLFVLAATYSINHADLFGLRQAILRFKGQPQSTLPFVERYLYRVVRHPIMLGFLIAFWSAPHMSTGRLAFALITTAYILVALQLEERDLERELGPTYASYKARVPMLIPGSPILRNR